MSMMFQINKSLIVPKPDKSLVYQYIDVLCKDSDIDEVIKRYEAAGWYLNSRTYLEYPNTLYFEYPKSDNRLSWMNTIGLIV